MLRFTVPPVRSSTCVRWSMRDDLVGGLHLDCPGRPWESGALFTSPVSSPLTFSLLPVGCSLSLLIARFFFFLWVSFEETEISKILQTRVSVESFHYSRKICPATTPPRQRCHSSWIRQSYSSYGTSKRGSGSSGSTRRHTSSSPT